MLDLSGNSFIFNPIYVDASMVVFNKPSGLLVIRDGYNPALPYLAGLAQAEFGRLWVVHRLDKDTSGVLVFARTASVHRNLNLQFENRQVKKEYHAIVFGDPPWDEFGCQFPLKINGDRKHRTVVDSISGKNAQTDFRVLERFGTTTLLACHPCSGYTHQIRAHLLNLGFPILGDPLYQFPRQRSPNLPTFTRLFLHACQIQFSHPDSGAQISIHAEYPQDFSTFLRTLQTRG
jgi:tRNA pseudouridine32 synthase / 23S rRNA pseudouridine746 synthase